MHYLVNRVAEPHNRFCHDTGANSCFVIKAHKPTHTHGMHIKIDIKRERERKTKSMFIIELGQTSQKGNGMHINNAHMHHHGAHHRICINVLPLNGMKKANRLCIERTFSSRLILMTTLATMPMIKLPLMTTFRLIKHTSMSV